MKNYESRLMAISEALRARKMRSAWNRGVKQYAIELLEDLKSGIEDGYIEPGEVFSNYSLFTKALLNGAENWHEYSWGGCSYIYDHQIASLLCSPSELKKTREGSRKPNRQEEWLDVQARALWQAAWLLWHISEEV